MTLVSHTQGFWIGSWWNPLSVICWDWLMHCGCAAWANSLFPELWNFTRNAWQSCGWSEVKLSIDPLLVWDYWLIVRNSGWSHFLLQHRPAAPSCRVKFVCVNRKQCIRETQRRCVCVCHNFLFSCKIKRLRRTRGTFLVVCFLLYITEHFYEVKMLKPLVCCLKWSFYVLNTDLFILLFHVVGYRRTKSDKPL